MSTQMKRLAAPRTWSLRRKVNVWVTKQSPGPHPIERSMPALIVMRDMLKICDTAKEAKRVIGNRELLIDGKPLRSPKMPIGLMDIVSIPKMKAEYRMLLTDKGKLTLVPVSEEEAKFKLCRIEKKTTVSKGKTQLNLHDGRNIVLDKDQYKSGDVLKINLEDQKIVESYPLTAGATVMIIEGNKSGHTSTVSESVVVRGPSPNIVRFTDGGETVKGNVFVIGSKKAAIKLPEASE
jgi:Ribosomal protein S4E